MAQAGRSMLGALAKPCAAAMMRGAAPQSAALASTSVPSVSAFDTQRAAMSSAAAPATKQNAAEFVVTKVKYHAHSSRLPQWTAQPLPNPPLSLEPPPACSLPLMGSVANVCR